MTIHDINNQTYGRPLSSVFVDTPDHMYDENSDPTIASLRSCNYRYLRFFYHPIKDKFLLINGWKDPLWTNTKSMRAGLDADERDSREQIFGQNIIDIQQKSFGRLLVDEVRQSYLSTQQCVLTKDRPYIPSTSSRWQVSYSGLWMNIIIMESASSLSLCSV